MVTTGGGAGVGWWGRCARLSGRCRGEAGSQPFCAPFMTGLVPLRNARSGPRGRLDDWAMASLAARPRLTAAGWCNGLEPRGLSVDGRDYQDRSASNRHSSYRVPWSAHGGGVQGLQASASHKAWIDGAVHIQSTPSVASAPMDKDYNEKQKKRSAPGIAHYVLFPTASSPSTATNWHTPARRVAPPPHTFSAGRTKGKKSAPTSARSGSGTVTPSSVW